MDVDEKFQKVGQSALAPDNDIKIAQSSMSVIQMFISSVYVH